MILTTLGSFLHRIPVQVAVPETAFGTVLCHPHGPSRIAKVQLAAIAIVENSHVPEHKSPECDPYDNKSTEMDMWCPQTQHVPAINQKKTV